LNDATYKTEGVGIKYESSSVTQSLIFSHCMGNHVSGTESYLG